VISGSIAKTQGGLETQVLADVSDYFDMIEGVFRFRAEEC